MFFSNPLAMPLNERQEKAWKVIENSLNEMRDTLIEINSIIRNNYLEIDLNEMNSNAWNEYVEFERKFSEITNKKRRLTNKGLVPSRGTRARD